MRRKVNALSIRQYEDSVLSGNKEGDRILSLLQSDGIAISHARDLFGEQLFGQLSEFVNKEVQNLKPSRKKKFLAYLWDNSPTLLFSNPILSVSRNESIIAPVSKYFGLLPRLSFMSVNKTFLSGGEDAAGSQRWHRDPTWGDERMCKVFVYLSDVQNVDAGPFTFVKKSHATGAKGHIFPARPPYGLYPPEGAVEESFSQDDVISCLGEEGTVIFCDTSGLHKGGNSKTKERVMMTLYYSSPASLQKPNFVVTDLEAVQSKFSPADKWLFSRG